MTPGIPRRFSIAFGESVTSGAVTYWAETLGVYNICFQFPGPISGLPLDRSFQRLRGPRIE
ncbi:hypothetical protein BDV12DRAFT_172541 [Aspergillus spectabilis]